MFDFSDIKSLADLLSWLVGGGAFIALSIAVSWIPEGFYAWHKLSSGVRSFLIAGIAAIIGAGATALSNDPAVMVMLEPYFKTFFAGLTVWLISQKAHASNPNR